MKKIILSMSVVALIFATSCKKETTTEITPTSTTETTTISTDVTALQTAYDDAVLKLEEAKKSGDAEAEKIAQEAVDNAKTSWETAKNKAAEMGTDMKEDLDETGAKIEGAANKVNEDAKESVTEAKAAINTAKDNTVEAATKAKADAEAAAAKAKEDAKKGYNNSLEKMKAK